MTVLSVDNDTRTCHSDGTDMFIELLRDELRILSKRLAFAGNPWCFAIWTHCFEKCTYCFANFISDLRNVPKRLRKTVMCRILFLNLCCYSFSQSLWFISQIRIDILKTTCSIFTSVCHLCTWKKQFLIYLNTLRMLWYIHAHDYVQFSALSYIINCLCHVDQNVL